MATQKIPEWSAQLTANGPKEWRAEIGRQAFALGVSSGELMRRLLFAGARAEFPGMAKKLAASHKRYYPSRSLGSGLVWLLTGLMVWQVLDGREAPARRARGNGGRLANVRQVRWDEVAAGA